MEFGACFSFLSTTINHIISLEAGPCLWLNPARGMIWLMISVWFWSMCQEMPGSWDEIDKAGQMEGEREQSFPELNSAIDVFQR